MDRASGSTRGARFVHNGQIGAADAGAADLGTGLPGRAVVRGSGEPAPRFRDGERLHRVFEQRCAEWSQAGVGPAVELVTGETYSFADLDRWANQLARVLLTRGVRPGARVGLLVEEPIWSYVGMLAALKVHAAFVPLDPAFPAERVAFITADAEVDLLLTSRGLDSLLTETAAQPLFVEDLAAELAAHSESLLRDGETGPPVDELAYVIYTSGSTGTPKGVAIDHASIVNFVRVAADEYGYRPGDRVYQGLTIAFDFSVEEIWVPLMAGATLVPKPSSAANLVGDELGAFLREHRITAIACVPTLLASLDTDLPDLRFLLVSGEACPQDLVARWWTPQRRFLNVYGPTEATVTATWALLEPDRPVTLGEPLPTYAIAILDPETHELLEPGQTGEIAIAGIGLARNYLNRPDKTAASFIPDFLGLEHNPSQRLYLTGDLGTLGESGDIEYHGRIDTQVKIRGYRIELTEIENTVLAMDGIAQAVVDTHQPEGSGNKELVAYYSLTTDTIALEPDQIHRNLREQLPAYMVPAYLEQLPTIPLMPSGKADRKQLPAPQHRHRTTGHDHTPPRTPTERTLVEALAVTLDAEPAEISATAHLFRDLAANSLHLAHLRSQLRAIPQLPALSVRQMYENPTIADLAAVLDATPLAPEPSTEDYQADAAQVSTLKYLACGLGQLLLFTGYLYLVVLAFTPLLDWVAAAPDVVTTYLRSLATGGALFAGLCTAPVAIKWLLVGRWSTDEFPVWGWKYLRFWFVKALMRANPLMLFLGTPLYNLYLRALGAEVSPSAVILTRYVPVCTDLVTIGPHAVVRKDAYVTGYRAEAGTIHPGKITLGAHALVGEASVLDINTSIGDHAQLAHASALHTGDALPAGTHWHGSPAEQTHVDYLNVDPMRVSKLAMISTCVMRLLPMLVIYLPLGLGAIDDSVLEGRWAFTTAPPTQPLFYAETAAAAAAVVLLGIPLGVLLMTTVPRLLAKAVKPGTTYSLHSWRFGLQRLVTRLTNIKFFMNLFGDSVYIPHFLRAVGYELTPLVQTGSNFGAEQQHENPYLTTIGTGTMVSDGLSMMNTWTSSSSFRVDHGRIGERNFLGNGVHYPAGGRTGDNVLLATKVMVPIDGEVRENTGLLGSPAFEIPRSVERDSSAVPDDPRELRRRIRAKTWHNTSTIAIFLATRWLYLFGAFSFGFAEEYLPTEPSAVAVVIELGGIFLGLVYFTLLERAANGFRQLRPRSCSIYERAFWRHERLWKLLTPALTVLDGTPFKNLLWRLLGVRIGRKVFDDGCSMPEKTLVSIGDGATLNQGSVIQAHSLEDGGFKSDHVVVERGATLGVGAFVHYGTTVGEGATVEADAFLMKGETVGPRQRWRGNPAVEVSRAARPAAAGALQPS
jgi:non-ribosomal peptide synthetase-like protein